MRFTTLLPLLALTLLLAACGNSSETMAEVEENATEATENMTTAEVTLTPMPPTQEFTDAAITDWDYQGGKFMYKTKGYEFAVPTPDADAVMCANSGKGQHVHLIVNNEPYIAKYEPTFEQDLPEGEHFLLTFLSRSYHESIKTPAAHRAVLAMVKDGSFTSTTDVTEPMLFYSRPKGTYVGERETINVMLDFYPVNAALGEDGYTVQVNVNGGKPMMIDTWQPYYLTNLPMGDNKVTLTLMKDGVAVDTKLNPVTREFTLEADLME